jgi:8-amino-7-oxononanoate synthase
MPFSVVVAIEQSYDFVISSQYDDVVKHLFDLSTYLQESLLEHGYTLLTSEVTRSPIIPVKMPNPRPLAAWLKENGIAVVPLTFPNVPRKTERLRICVHAGNKREEADALVSMLVRWRVQNPEYDADFHIKEKL